MPSPSTGPDGITSADVILQWLDDLHSSQVRLDEWSGLDLAQRAHWLEQEGYSAAELSQSLIALVGSAQLDVALVGAIERFLGQGEAIPASLHSSLAALLVARLERLEAVAGGSGLSFGLTPQGPTGPLADYKAAHGAAAKAQRLLQEAQATQLGRFIEAGGGLEDKVAEHLWGQIETEVLTATQAAQSVQNKVATFKDNHPAPYQARQQTFIRQKEDEAVSLEDNLLTGEKAARAAGHQPVDRAIQAERQAGDPPPVLGAKEQAVVKDDVAYFKEHDLATLQASLTTRPSITVSGEGSSRTLSLTYDWDGARGSVEIDQSTATAELDPTLTALNRLTAQALWSARQSAAINSFESQQLPLWKQQLNKVHPRFSNGLHKAVHTNFPKATLPSSFSQLIQQAQAGEAALRGALHSKLLRARRHGVTLLSLQRRWDVKQLKQNTNLPQRLEAALDLRAAVRVQLKQMALADLVAGVHKQLTSSKARTFASNHASLLRDLKDQPTFLTLLSDLRDQRTLTTLTFSDRTVEISWTLGVGVEISSTPRNPRAGSSDDPTLTLESQSRSDPQNSLRLSVSDEPGGEVTTSWFRSREDASVVRQGGNAYTLTGADKQRLQPAAAFAADERQAYEASLWSSSQQAAAAELNKHSRLPSPARRQSLSQRFAKNARTIHRVRHDLRVDRRIEARLRPEYGSLRAQKLLLNQLQTDRAIYVEEVEALRRIQDVKQILKTHNDRGLWHKGVTVDQKDIKGAKKVYQTKPYSLQKKASGNGYQLVPKGSGKDYWQTLSQKQRYAIFDPIYISEKIFYTSERQAFLAGAGEYTTLRRHGASRKMARLGASATYFNTLLQEDKTLFLKGQADAFDGGYGLAYAPFVLRRQLHVAKRVVHLNHHPFAWRLRLRWKIQRETYIHKHVDKYEQYMLNNKFTGFHPFHRIARKTMTLFKATWNALVRPILHILDRSVLDVISLFSPKAAKWTARIGGTIWKSAKFLAWHLVKALWRLPERLYHHTIFFGKQLLFALTHPWEYRKIWSGLQKDFKGIYKLGKTVFELLVWVGSVLGRSLYQMGRWVTGNGTNWASVLHGAYSHKLIKKGRLIRDAFKYAGLATLVGSTAFTKAAIKIELLRMQLRRDLHHDGFLRSPWRHFVHTHKSFVQSEIQDLGPTRVSALLAAYSSKRQALANDHGQLTRDLFKYETNATYKAAVKAKALRVKTRAAALSGKLKPQVQPFLDGLANQLLNQISNVKHKTKKVKRWTLRQYGLDFGQILKAYRDYEGLGTVGQKEVLIAIKAFEDLNKTHKSGVIKATLQVVNSNALARKKEWANYFRTGKYDAGTYAYAVNHDWVYIGKPAFGKLLLALQYSVKGPQKQEVRRDLVSRHVGRSLFGDIIGGFWLAHYGKLFATKDASLIAGMRQERAVLAAKMSILEMVVSQPRVKKLTHFWMKRNANSALAKDLRGIDVFGRALERKIHKWERIERIGHTRISADDLFTLQSLHKNQLLGSTLAAAVAGTRGWQQLTLEQQEQYRTSYDSWISYNQQSVHGLDHAYSKFKSQDKSEYAAWQAERSEIVGGDSLTVGALLLSLKSSDSNSNISEWVTIPKPPLANANQHLLAVAGNLAAVASDPYVLAVSVATHASNHSNTPVPRPTPSLFAYGMQIWHWSHKIFGDKHKKAQAEKAEQDAQAVKEKEAETKKAVETDDAVLKKQVGTAKEQLADGSKDRQQILDEAKQADSSSLEAIAQDKDVDLLANALDHDDSIDLQQLVQELEGGDLELSRQQLARAGQQEQLRLEQELRQAADDDRELRLFEDAARADLEIQHDTFKQDVKDQAEQLLAPEKHQLDHDLTHDAFSLEGDVKIELEQDLEDSSDLLDQTVYDIKEETRIAEDDLVVVDEDLVTAAEDMAV